jgi:hypothetical protein
VVEVVLVDSSILCEVMKIPGMHAQHEETLDQLRRLHDTGARIVVPLAAVIETGNHVAQNGDGRQRRRCAERFREFVQKAVRQEIPFHLQGIDAARLDDLLKGFPESAMRGVGLGDQTILDAYNEACVKLPTARVRIWSFDRHLAGLDRVP